jgi:hypothetical protein
MGLYEFKVVATRPAGGIRYRPGVAREKTTAWLEVQAEDEKEAIAKAKEKAIEVMVGWDFVRVKLIK